MLSNIKDSRYFIIGNLTFTFNDLLLLPTQCINSIKVILPDHFRFYQGKKYIKFYGCTLSYLTHNIDENDEVSENMFNPIHVTLHSNIVNSTNTDGKTNKESVLIFTSLPPQHINNYSNYVSTTNNYLNQKIFEIDDSMMELEFYFTDQYGERVNTLVIEHEYEQVFDGEGNAKKDEKGNNVYEETKFYSFQCLYKIEMELIKC
jgi:hypothetical protein